MRKYGLSKRRLFFLTVCIMACAPDPGTDAGPIGDADVDAVPTDDADGDGISDEHEGRRQGTDTDGDGTPDYLDSDSDDDTIADVFEGGNGRVTTAAPADSDGDGTPDFRDVDSDANGIFDINEHTQDLNLDGEADWIDADDDGDGLTDTLEIAGNPSSPLDFDEDGTPDYRDEDSDNDTISDAHEGMGDFDGDGTEDRHDLDSDDDTIPDAIEAGDDNLDTRPVDTDEDFAPDYRDNDSDADGLTDEFEWLHRDQLGTNYQRRDSDGDDVDDMIEWAAGTGIADPDDNPRTRDDFVFVVPYEDDPRPAQDALDFSTAIQIADVYFLMDRTGSMSEIGVMQTRLTDIIDLVTCGAGEDPEATGCIPDLWVGFGWFTESDSRADDDGMSSYTNIRNLTSEFAQVQAAIPGVTTSGDDECQRKAVYCAAHGPGDSCPSDAQSLDAACPDGHLGFPCFRPDAARMLVLVTDENMDQDSNPAYDTVGAALVANAITFVGINAEAGGSSAVDSDLRSIARASGQAEGSELVYRGDSDDVVTAVESAVNAVANVPFDVGALPVDDPTDFVDATDFIEYLETNTTGGVCTAWDGLADSDQDGHPDRFIALPPRTPVCWDVHAAINTIVPATDEPQLFIATIEVRGGPGETLLDSRRVYFLVPPEFYEPPPG